MGTCSSTVVYAATRLEGPERTVYYFGVQSCHPIKGLLPKVSRRFPVLTSKQPRLRPYTKEEPIQVLKNDRKGGRRKGRRSLMMQRLSMSIRNCPVFNPWGENCSSTKSSRSSSCFQQNQQVPGTKLGEVYAPSSATRSSKAQNEQVIIANRGLRIDELVTPKSIFPLLFLPFQTAQGPPLLFPFLSFIYDSLVIDNATGMCYKPCDSFNIIGGFRSAQEEADVQLLYGEMASATSSGFFFFGPWDETARSPKTLKISNGHNNVGKGNLRMDHRY